MPFSRDAAYFWCPCSVKKHILILMVPFFSNKTLYFWCPYSVRQHIYDDLFYHNIFLILTICKIWFGCLMQYFVNILGIWVWRICSFWTANKPWQTWQLLYRRWTLNLSWLTANGFVLVDHILGLCLPGFDWNFLILSQVIKRWFQIYIAERSLQVFYMFILSTAM